MQSKYNLEKAAYSVDELTRILPIGRTKIYEAIKLQRLPKKKYGKRTLIMAADVEALLDRIVAGEAA